jgi:hypothetical protein
LKGKLKSVVKAFEKASPNNDASEVEALISLAEAYNWDIKSVELLVKLELSGPLVNSEDISHFDSLVKLANQSSQVVKLTEIEKLDKLNQLTKTDIFRGDADQISAIIHTLKLD